MIGFFEGLQPEGSGQDLKMHSIVTGIVKENWDDAHQGMLKVEYPVGETGKNVSGWVPVMSAYTGNGFGIYMLPEVGTEVVIAFRLGDRDCPIVIGALWNKTDKIPAETADKDNTVKLIRTRTGCQIRIAEEKGKEKIQIQTPGGLKVGLDDEEQSILLTDKDGKEQFLLDAKGKQVTVSADKKIAFKVGGKEILSMDSDRAALKAGTIAVEAGQSLSVKGQSSKYEGASVEMKASGTMKLEASGICQVKGSMLKLN